MLSFKKFFNTDPGNAEAIAESKVEAVIEITPTERQQLFDDAVKDVVKRQIQEKIKEDLYRLVMGDEVYEQTKEAMKLGYLRSAGEVQIAKEKFPKALIALEPYGCHRADLSFSANMLVGKLTEDLFVEEEDTKNEPET